MADRFVVLCVAGARSRWLGRIAGWATTAALPVELVTAMDVAEARAVIAAGRPLSALVVDAEAGATDRDLVELAGARSVPTIAVTGSRTRADVDDVGVAALLDDGFDATALREVLRRVARPVGRELARDLPAGAVTLDEEPPASPLIGVTGAGGSGSSTIAMAIAQGLVRHVRAVALVDGCRRGDLAVYHDEVDPVPGLPEAVEMHRGDRPEPSAVAALLREVPARGYRLLTGLRRTGEWTALRPHAVGATLEGLRRSHDAVVVDVDPDLDDEASTGSVDVEDRHSVTLAVAARCDLLWVVARADMHGLHRLAALIDDLVTSGVPPERIVPAVLGATRSPARRAAVSRWVRDLATGEDGRPPQVASPVHLRHSSRIEAAHRGVEPLPRHLVDPVTGATAGFLTRLGPREATASAARAVNPGSLGAIPHTHERVA